MNEININDLGMFIIPDEIVKKLDIRFKDTFEVFICDNSIHLKRKELEPDNSNIRKVDEFNRIVLPYKIRETLYIDENTSLNIDTDSIGTIILKKSA